MNRLIEYSEKGKDNIIVEVKSEAGQHIGDVAIGGEVLSKATTTFQDAMAKVKPAAEAIVSKFKELSDSPDEVTVEFGVKINAELGAIIASSGVDANFKVMLKWKK